MDLFSGSGPESQIHDYNPGIQPNELFWTTQIPDSSFRVSAGGRLAELRLSRLSLVDNFVGFGPKCVNAELDIFAQWRVTGSAVKRGLGKDGDESKWTRVEAESKPSRMIARVKGSQTGYGFRSNQLDADDFLAWLSKEKNGQWLD